MTIVLAHPFSVLTKPVKEGSLKTMLDTAQERRVKRLNAAMQLASSP